MGEREGERERGRERERARMGVGGERGRERERGRGEHAKQGSSLRAERGMLYVPPALKASMHIS